MVAASRHPGNPAVPMVPFQGLSNCSCMFFQTKLKHNFGNAGGGWYFQGFMDQHGVMHPF